MWPPPRISACARRRHFRCDRAREVNPSPVIKKHTRSAFRICTLLVAGAALMGCGVNGLRYRRDDNRHVRALQQATLSQHGDRPIAGQSIEAFFKNKVGLVAVKGGPLPIGRATPITSDGYYLTAWHVVDNEDFYLSCSSPDESPLTVVRHPGRVVWHDQAADLALVKFSYRPSAQFRAEKAPLKVGEPVFSGATGLNSGTRFTLRNESGIYNLKDLLKNSFGNGHFVTAGTVTRIRFLHEPSVRTLYRSTLVGRGGMSGAPIVNRTGNLVGILTGGQANLFSKVTTSFSMIEPVALEAMINADRSRHGVEISRNRPQAHLKPIRARPRAIHPSA